MKIIVIEPQCCGFEHASFNSALLDTLRIAYPSHTVAFFAEEGHLEFVRDKLSQAAGVRIVLNSIRIPSPNLSGLLRLPSEWRLCARFLGEASRPDVEFLVFCSTTPTCLLSLKLLMMAKRFKKPMLVVVHSVLKSIEGRGPRRPWNWFLQLKNILQLPHPTSLRLIVLGDSILENLARLLPNSRNQWISLDLVYECFENAGKGNVKLGSKPLHFGYVGVTGKGFDIFSRIADEIAPTPEVARFVIVGYFNGRPESKPASRIIARIPDRPLSREVFQAGMGALTYVVWTGNPDHYRLVASATFLDGLAFLKPGVYLRNDYIEHYFNRMGDMGYLCDSYDEMVETIRGIISQFPRDRYERQVENIRKGRVLFEPRTIAPRLRDIVRDVQAQCRSTGESGMTHQMHRPLK